MKKGLKILLAADGFILFAFGLLAPIYAIFVEHIGGDILDAGFAYAIYSFVLGVALYFICKWENHQKHKEKLVILSYFLYAVGALGYIFVANRYHLFIVQAVLGIAEAVNSPVFDGLFSKFLDKGKSVYEWGMYASLKNIAGGISAILGGVLVLYFGFKGLFSIMLAISLIGFFISIKLRKTKS